MAVASASAHNHSRYLQAMAVFRSVGSHKQRAPVHVPTGDLEGYLKPQQGLVMAVKEMAQEVLEHFKALCLTQQKLMRAANSYLASDFGFAALDESAMFILQTASDFFDEGGARLGKSGLNEVVLACDRILGEHRSIADLMKERDEAHREFEHYNGKVAAMMVQPGDKAKLDRNQEKLNSAQTVSDSKRLHVDAAVRTVVGRRIFHARTTLHSALQAYARSVAAWGARASPVVKAFEDEYRIGTPVEVVGFPKDSEMHGFNGVVCGKSDDPGMVCISLADGSQQKALRAEHLVPVGEPAETEEEEAKPAAPAIRVNPSRGSCDGCDAEVALTGFASDSPAITDVLVGGEAAQILKASSESLRIRIPPGSVRGPLRVEVRRDGWQQYVTVAEAAFQYYEAMGFGACGHHIELSTPSQAVPSEHTLSVATRPASLNHALAITAAPVPLLGEEMAMSRSAVALRRYFEVEVLEVADQKTTKALAIGFAWPLPCSGPRWPGRSWWAAAGRRRIWAVESWAKSLVGGPCSM